MSMFIGPTLSEVLSALPKYFCWRFRPITLGRLGYPAALLKYHRRRWLLVRLELDAAAAGAAARAHEMGLTWMPEQEWQFLREGFIILDTPSRSTLIDGLRNLPESLRREILD